MEEEGTYLNNKTMTDIEFEQFLHQMSKENLDKWLRRKGQPFDSFANALAGGVIANLAPPFDEYSNYTGSLIDFYKNFFQRYLQCLEKIDSDTWKFVNSCMSVFIKHYGGPLVDFDLVAECKMLMNSIIKSLSAYFNGSPNMAYRILEHTFVDKNFHLLNTLPQIQYIGPLYRVRGERNLSAQKELFHTPFELRNCCGSYRYSILGYPSLYLAGSIETALAESRIVDNQYSVVLFRSNEILQCIDLSLPSRELSFWERYSLVLFYPLIFACGLKVKDESKPFKPEYVIPQLLFQVVSECSDLMGVSYTSTRMENPDYRNGKQRNFVLKVPKADKAKGQSLELAGKFKCTMPVSPHNNEDALSVENRLGDMELYEIKLN
mgnify:FL=1